MIPLREFVVATANGSGRASVTIGPARYGDLWHVKLLTSECNSLADVQLKIYRNVESESARIESTYSGKSDTSPCDHTIRAGEKLVFVWTGADAGSACTSRIEGDMESLRFG